MKNGSLLRIKVLGVQLELNQWARDNQMLGPDEKITVRVEVKGKGERRQVNEDDHVIIREKLLPLRGEEYRRVKDEIILERGLTKHQVGAIETYERNKQYRFKQLKGPA